MVQLLKPKTKATLCRVEVVTDYDVIKKLIQIPWNAGQRWQYRKNARIKYLNSCVKDLVEQHDLSGRDYEVVVYVMSKG